MRQANLSNHDAAETCSSRGNEAPSGVWSERTLGLGFVALMLWASTAQAATQTIFKFDFGPGKVTPGHIQVLPESDYSPGRGCGFDLGSKVTAVDRGGDDPPRGHFCTSDRPFFFSVRLPEGNYNVTLTFGDPQGATTNTVKAESRRLMLENVITKPGEFVTRMFTVNIRTPKIASGGEVKLKPREAGPPLVLHWDDKLTVEFNGARPCVCGLEVTKVDDAITVYLAG